MIMINVLIVEDEYLARMFLSNLIKWEENGMKLIGCAKDGVEALEIMNKENVHIVISDLKMPKMNGIELLRELNSIGFAGKFIVMSNYNEFQDVKMAMKQGAYDYILKVTATEQEVLEVLRKVIKELKVNSHELTEEDIEKYSDELTTIHEYITEVLHSNKEWSIDEEFENKWISSVTMAYVRISKMNVESLEKEYKIHQYISNIMYSFSNLIEAESIVLVDLSRNEFAIIILNREEKIANIEILLSKIKKNIKNYLDVEVELAKTKVFSSVKETREYIKEIQMEQSFMLQKSFSSYRDEVKVIIDYIDENLTSKVTLTDIANLVNMNKSYISRLFKEETSMTLSEYITYRKIDRAVILMKNPKLKIKEIAFEVGIPDPLYFSRIFTKVQGKTPSEFREQYLNRA